MEKTTLVAIVLGFLVLVAAVQAFQLNSLKDKVTEVKVSSSSTPVANSGSTEKRTTQLPSSIKELPQMVGGC